LRFSRDKIRFEGCTADNGDNTLATFFNFLTGIVSGGTISGNIPPGGCVTWDLPPGGVVGPPGLISRELKENSWSWRLALDYEVSEDTSKLILMARSCRSRRTGKPRLMQNMNGLSPGVRWGLQPY
jgi:hypothetical protein